MQTASTPGDFIGHILPDRVASLGLFDAMALYRNLGTLVSVIDGMVCKPCFGGGRHSTPAGALLEEMRDEMESLRQATVARISAIRPEDADERSYRGAILLGSLVEQGGSPEEIMSAAFAVASAPL